MRKRPVTIGKTDINIRIDEELKIELQAQAAREDRSLANMIGHAARVYLDGVSPNREAAA